MPAGPEPRLRFAPSPTGYLHIGNLRPALYNWLFAKAGGGAFVLRLDDTDRERSRDEYARAVVEDLAWIGIEVDEFHRQSDRIAIYDRAAEALRAKGLLYPCYETPDELDRKRKRALARGLPPVYGREALRLTAEDRERLEADDRRPHWRFLLPNFARDPFETQRTEIVWDDLVRGEQRVDLASLSDPVLVREDGTYLYTLPSVVDDGEMGITHVLRGEDHVTNTAVQIAILKALGHALPVFGHINLLTTIDGEGLSKRSGALSLRSLRADGYEPMAVASLAVLTGAAGSIEAVATLDALAQRLDLSALSHSSAKFDPADLDRLNADLVHAMDARDVAGRLARIGVPETQAETFWRAVRGNCAKAEDARLWWEVVERGGSDATFEPEDAAFLAEARRALPAGPFDGSSWKAWTDVLKTATGRKGKALFLPLRRALTGLDRGPDLAALLPVIGHERARQRLERFGSV